MYRTLAIVSGVITGVIFIAYCALGLLDPQSQFMQDYGYTLGLVTLPFCCGVAPLSAILTVVFGILAMNQPRSSAMPPPPDSPKP